MSITLTITVVGNGIKLDWNNVSGSYNVNVNGNILTTTSSNTYAISNLACGIYTYTISSNTSGITSNQVTVLSLNSCSPSFNITGSYANGIITISTTASNTGNGIVIGYTGSDNIIINPPLGINFTSPSTPVQVSTPGSYNFRVFYLDPAGNITSVSNPVTVVVPGKTDDSWSKFLPYFLIIMAVLVVVIIVLVANRNNDEEED